MSDGSAPKLKPISLEDFGETDAARMRAVAQTYRAALSGYFAKRVREQADVDDLVQDVFLRLMRRDGARGIEKLEQYLFRTAANVLKDRARRATARHAGEHDPFDEDRHAGEAISPERILLGRESIAHLTAALKEMPERRRTVFVLHRFEGRSYSEIAKMLGVSVSTVEKHIVRAHAFLYRRLRGSP